MTCKDLFDVLDFRSSSLSSKPVLCFPIKIMDSWFQAYVYVSDNIYSRYSRSVHFSRRLCQIFLSDPVTMEQVWDEKGIYVSPSFSSKHSFTVELIVLTLCRGAHNQIPYRNLSILFQSTYLIKENLSVTGKDRKLFWQDQCSINPCLLTLTEPQLLIYCFCISGSVSNHIYL